MGEVRNGRAEISGDDAHHLTRVLRVEAGEQLRNLRQSQRLFGRSGDRAQGARGFSDHLKNPSARARSIDPLCGDFQIRSFRMDDRKGHRARRRANSSFRSPRAANVAWTSAAHKRVERWRRIALEASQQSRRAIFPEIDEPVSSKAASATPANHRYALDEDAGAQLIASAFPAARDASRYCRDFWLDPRAAGPTTNAPNSLPPDGRPCRWALILRAETAAIAGSCKPSLNRGRWRINNFTELLDTGN